MKVPGSKIVPCQGVLGANHSLTFGLFTQVSGSGPLGPLVSANCVPSLNNVLINKKIIDFSFFPRNQSAYPVLKF